VRWALKLLKTDCPLRYTTFAPFVTLAERPHRLLGVEAHDSPAPYIYRHGLTTNVYRACFLKIQDHLLLNHVPWVDTDKIKVFRVDLAGSLLRVRPLTTWPCFRPLLDSPHSKTSPPSPSPSILSDRNLSWDLPPGSNGHVVDERPKVENRLI